MLGMFTDYVPKFVRQFASVGDIMKGAFKDYIQSVQDGSFPAEEQLISLPQSLFYPEL